MDWAKIARKTLPRVDDAAEYLARIKRPLRAPREPDMSLGSPLFDSMYAADRAYEQLAKGRTGNLRNAGGDFARIAGQAIREENAAARAARNAMPFEQALQVDPRIVRDFALPLAATMTGAGAGLVIQDAMAERKRLRDEAQARAAEAAEAYAAQKQENARLQADLDALHTGVSADSYESPEYDMQLASDTAANSYPPEPRVTWKFPFDRAARRDVLVPDEPNLFTDEDKYDSMRLLESMDPVSSQVISPEEDADLVYTEDDWDAITQAADARYASDVSDVMRDHREESAAAYQNDFPQIVYDEIRNPQPPLPPTWKPKPAKPRQGVRPLPQKSEGMWY